MPNKDVIPIPGSKTQFNIKPDMAAQGIAFPPGSFAVYDTSTASAVMWNTKSNIALFSTLLSSGRGPAVLINTTISVVEFEPKTNAHFSPMPVAVSEFVKQLKAPMRLLSFASGVSTSGNGLLLANIQNAEFTKNLVMKPFAKGMTGLKAAVYSTISSVTNETELAINFRFRSDPKQTNGKSVNVFFSTTTVVKNQYPVVIYTQMIPNSGKDKSTNPSQGIAIIVCGKTISAGGWKVGTDGKLIP